MIKDGRHGLTESYSTENVPKLGHKIYWKYYSVLVRASSNYYLKIKEALLIKERMPVMNNNETWVILYIF